jgi:hypothetical protein
MYYKFENQTKAELINNINKSFIDTQKTYNVQKKYWIKPITDIKLNELNYYSTISEHTIVHINSEYAHFYYQFKNKKPFVCIVVSTRVNSDQTIDTIIVSSVQSRDLIINKYNEIQYLLHGHYWLEDNYEYNQYLEFCKKYKEREKLSKFIPCDDVYELRDNLTEYDYNQNTLITIKFHTSEIYEHVFIEVFIHDRISKRTLYMGRVFYEYKNSTLNTLLYNTIADGFKKFRTTNKSKINIGESILKLSAFMKTLKENINLNLVKVTI